MMEHARPSSYTQLNETFQRDILEWMVNFVEKPNAQLGGWAPCPYARKARLQNKVNLFYSSPESYFQDVFSTMQNFNDEYDVYVIGTDPNAFSLNQFVQLKDNIRQQFIDQDIWPLFDHPHDKEFNNGLCFNNGKYLLAMIQKLSKLNEASEKLKEEGYYNGWDQDYLSKLFSSRPKNPKINKY